jgi:acetate kinase
MTSVPLQVLTINGGSSSIKFSLYALGDSERKVLSAQCDGIGLGAGRFRVQSDDGSVLFESSEMFSGHESALAKFLQWLSRHSLGCCVDAIGHRVVHGGLNFTEPVVITPVVQKALGELRHLDPEHLVPEMRAIDVAKEMFPRAVHVACFDTAFHRQMPALAQMYPLPRKLAEQGVIRYGFHGLSFEYLLQKLASEAGSDAAQGRVVIAHLGGGSSIAAINGGRSIDTTMGYMPNGGLMMGTRSGDLCPGVLMHLLLDRNLSPVEVNNLVNFQSGLLGVSGVSRDMKDLLRVASTNPNAAEAIDLFCYTAKKHLASMIAVLGGVDTLIFSGGIGENAPTVRRMICDKLEFLGIGLDQSRNRQSASVISLDGSPVTVRVMATNEELVIARATGRIARVWHEEDKTVSAN